MNDSTFKRLTSSFTQHFDDCDCVDLRAGTQIEIFAWRHDGFKLQIENGSFTEEQKNVLQALINNAVSTLDDHFKEVNQKKEDYVDPYEYNGVRRSDFY